VSLEPGRQLLHFRLAEKIGEGGMGEVWRASDTTLNRDVAIKVLPAAFAADPERLARFEREAQVLASLNHPGIAAVHGLHEAGGVRFLVMELVPGEDLSAGLARGALPLDEAIETARHVAEALGAAHEQGVIHRDLKPANVKRTPDGKVKILDFGLAKALEPGSVAMLSSAATAAPTRTLAGTVLGTVGYMSPEQSRGQPVDRRADLWAFGCLLYEMLTGRRAFEGAAAADALAAVLTKEPDYEALPAATPRAVRRLLRRCLEKDPRRRLRDAGDAALLLDETGEARDPRASEGRPATAPLWRRVAPWTLTAALAAALAAFMYLGGNPRTSGRAGAPARVAVRLPVDVRLDMETNVSEHQILAISPDGSRLAFVGVTGNVKRLYVRRLDRFEVTPLTGTEDASSPFFSPDGRWLAFFARGRLKKIPVDGGQPIDLCEVGLQRGGAWGPDGTIVFAPSTTSALFRIPSGGGAPAELTRLDPARKERTHRWPSFLPGGDEVLFTIGVSDKPGTYEDSEIDAVSLGTGRRRTLLRGASMARHAASGHLVLGRRGQLLAMPLAAANGGPAASAIPVARDVAGVATSGVLFFDLAENGTLVYAEADPKAAELELAWVRRDGTVEPLPLPIREYRAPRVSPEGKRIAFAIGPGRGAESDIWIHDLPGGTTTRLTFDGASAAPVWTRDGTRVAFGSRTPAGDVLAWKATDGSDEAKTIVSFPDSIARSPLCFTPDGETIVYEQDSGPGRSVDLMALAVADARVREVARSAAIELGGDISPDGRWLAYQSDETGSAEVYVQAFPGPGGRWQVTDGGGNIPHWSPDGRELFYVRNQRMTAVEVRTSPIFSHGNPRELFGTRFPSTSDVFANYDVTADGRFLMVRTTGEVSTAQHVNVVLDWLEVLGRAAERK
jgi:serine/threonine-protein kinase